MTCPALRAPENSQRAMRGFLLRYRAIGVKVVFQ